ncbi:targeting protein for Xklp2 isoform X2 [Drosophila nasuta]|uniref:targeting protein for Xklp2 isoform X2 n=1 Tax=Drosophila nasuta TaxID=42062 RepID=UPI00295F210C|nr:targeting protein for Xklp2 isoform X2 [Drosophila nasuta]
MDAFINDSNLIKFDMDCDDLKSAADDCASTATITSANDADKENTIRTHIPLDWNNCSSPVAMSIKAEESAQEEESVQPVRPKLKLNWSTDFEDQDRFNDGGNNKAPPRAYEYFEVYQDRKEKAIKQREDEERRARQFHSRPVPNFRALHRKLEDIRVIHRITVPITPETMKHSQAYKEKHKDQNGGQIDNIDSHPDVKEERKHRLETKPFKLHTNQRVRERQEFDAVVKINMAQKKNKEDEQRKQQELEQKKELRKLTEFKARPNPFK